MKRFCYVTAAALLWFGACHSENILLNPGVTLPEDKPVVGGDQEVFKMQRDATSKFVAIKSADGEQDYGPVFTLLDTAIQSHPEVLSLYLTKGNFLLSLKRYPEAESTLGIASKLAPRMPEIYVGRAQALEKMGEKSQSQQNLRMAVAAYNLQLNELPNDPNLLVNRAFAVYLFGDKKQALSEIEKILTANPKMPVAQILKKGIESGPQDPWLILEAP